MNKHQLIEQIHRKRSFLCVGLDPEITKIPVHLRQEEDPIFSFNKAIIDATEEFAVAYKPNVAFYEALGLKGWQSLERTIKYLNEKHKNVFTIADAKRGDIGNTSRMYAEAFLKNLDFDSITVAPYMGEDSVRPFLQFEGKWAIVLALTSNNGAMDFQLLTTNLGRKQKVFEKVIEHSRNWGTPENMMYVVGATRGEMLKEVRSLAPDHFFLVPGVGAQGGKLSDVAKCGLNKEVGLLVNSSRGIIYAADDVNFAEAAFDEAKKLSKEMGMFV
jgi:orotidine-5'-phosphate decarboxylase